MEEVAASTGARRGLRHTAAALLQPANLRPFLTVLALFLLFPLTGVYNISFFAVSLFTRLGLGGAETVAVFTALVRCGGTLASTLLLLRSGGALHQPLDISHSVQGWEEGHLPCHHQPGHPHHWHHWSPGHRERCR